MSLKQGWVNKISFIVCFIIFVIVVLTATCVLVSKANVQLVNVSDHGATGKNQFISLISVFFK